MQMCESLYVSSSKIAKLYPWDNSKTLPSRMRIKPTEEQKKLLHQHGYLDSSTTLDWTPTAIDLLLAETPQPYTIECANQDYELKCFEALVAKFAKPASKEDGPMAPPRPLHHGQSNYAISVQLPDTHNKQQDYGISAVASSFSGSSTPHPHPHAHYPHPPALTPPMQNTVPTNVPRDLTPGEGVYESSGPSPMTAVPARTPQTPFQRPGYGPLPR